VIFSLNFQAVATNIQRINLTSLPTKVRVFKRQRILQLIEYAYHSPPPPELLPGYEVPTKYKEAIRQLHGFAKMPLEAIIDRYKLSKSRVRKILNYKAPERARPTRTGRPSKLNDLKVL
jgi:hypothetical protein